jgi:hypothetical protein
MSETRKATNKILEMIDEQLLDPKDVVIMCLKWMSEDDVREMAEANEIELEEEEEDDDTPSYPYIINVGERADNLRPFAAFPTKERAIESGKFCASHGYTYAEVVYMPEDDDINEVVWKSWEDNENDAN